MLKVVSTSILTIYNFDRCGSTRIYEFPFPGHLWQKYVNSFVRYRTRLELRVSLAGSREATREEPPGRAEGERQIRNEFFCFEAPRKTSNAKENDSRLLPDGGEPRRATSSRGETRKESKEAVRVCETFSAAMYAASARVANLAHLYERARVRVKFVMVRVRVHEHVCAAMSARAHAGI